MPFRRLIAPAALAVAATLALAGSAAAAEPALTVAKPKLRAALKCTPGVKDATRTPVMLVTGTGASGDEAYLIGKGAFDAYGAPVCRVNFPNHTTADIQVSVQYLVYGLRTMAARAGRPVAVIGISQGGLLPRVALTYWPSLRKQVSDVVAAAGTQHGTTVGSLAACRQAACTPAVFQQIAGLALPEGAQPARPRRDPRPDRLDHRALLDRRGRPADHRPAPGLGAARRHQRADPGRLPGPPGDPHRHRAGLRDLRAVQPTPSPTAARPSSPGSRATSAPTPTRRASTSRARRT